MTFLVVVTYAGGLHITISQRPQTMGKIIITGASDGIGAAAARQLKQAGKDVVIVGRSRTKTQALATDLGVPFHLADFGRLAEVRRLAQELLRYDDIDVLANNAGGIMGARELTEDGFEKTFQINHLAPFLLTTLLLDRLVSSRSKVIQTTSTAANLYGKHFDITDLNNSRNYQPHLAYGNAKLANVLFTRELHRRYHTQGLAAVAFHPGVVRSSFASETTHFMRFLYHSPLKYLITISPQASAHRLTKLVTGMPGMDWQPGQVYDGDKPMPVNLRDDDGRIARELWEQSEKMLASVHAIVS